MSIKTALRTVLAAVAITTLTFSMAACSSGPDQNSDPSSPSAVEGRYISEDGLEHVYINEDSFARMVATKSAALTRGLEAFDTAIQSKDFDVEVKNVLIMEGTLNADRDIAFYTVGNDGSRNIEIRSDMIIFDDTYMVALGSELGQTYLEQAVALSKSNQ